MEYQKLLPFDEYLQRLFLPALGDCLRSARYEFVPAAAALFEAIRWVELGVDARLFSISAGQALLSEYGAQVAKQFKLFPQEFHYILPELTRTHLAKVVSLGELSVGVGFEAPEWVARRLELVLEIVSDINHRKSARSLSAALIFLKPDEFEALASDQVAEADVLEATADDTHLRTDGYLADVLAGCIHSMAHIERVLTALDFTSRPESVTLNDWGTLRQAVHDIHGWRFLFQDKEVERRLGILFSRLSGLMAGSLDAIGIDIRPDGLAQYLRDIADRWSDLGRPALRYKEAPA
jgi:hypothetical protein